MRQCGLTAAGFADERQAFARKDLQIEVLYGANRLCGLGKEAISARVPFVELVNVDKRSEHAARVALGSCAIGNSPYSF